VTDRRLTAPQASPGGDGPDIGWARLQRLWPYAAVVLVVAVGVAVHWDRMVALWSLAHCNTPCVRVLREVVTPVGSAAPQGALILLLLGLGAGLRNPCLARMGKALFVAFLVASVLATGLKLGVRRARPMAMDQPRPSLADQLGKGQWHSFPSGDVLTTTALVVGGLCLAQRRRRWCWLLVLPLVVGAGRIVAAKHFPSDVVGGLALGAVAGLVAVALSCRRGRSVACEMPGAAVPGLPELDP
jgi:hypothetical protein